MRYEGAARRSQTYNKSIIDKIWNFFSSVKVGIGIIIVTLIASSIGTIFPQEMFIPPGEDPATFYAEEHGALGQIYYSLGLHNLYGSWWYMLLIAALGTSIIIASIDRFFPLYKALKHQRVTRHQSFMKRQRIFGTSNVNEVDTTMEKAQGILKKKRYNVFEENGNILAEKNRWARWGPYVNHIGLIIFLIGASLRFFPGMYIDENVWVREGETTVIPGTSGDYYIENLAFTVDFYDEDDERYQAVMEENDEEHIETFHTDAVLYTPAEGSTVGLDQELEEVDRHGIEVNDSFDFDGYSLYQVDYKMNELKEMSFEVEDRETNDVLGSFTVDLNDPDDGYTLDDEQVRIHSYFPNFVINEDGVPSTENNVPDNPGFIFEMEDPDTGDLEHTFLGIQANYDVSPDDEENRYEFSFDGIETNNVTGLTVRKDNTLPFLIVGGSIFLIGLVQGSYWPHRRIWLQRKNDEVWLAAHTNKNWESLKKDIDAISEETEVTTPQDQTDEEHEKSESQENNLHS